MKKLLVSFLIGMAVMTLLPTNASAQSSSADDVDTKYAVDLPKAGTEAPDFQLQTIDGKTIKLSQYRGQYCVLDFWASWCGDCRKDMPEMKRIYDRFSKQGVQFVGISFDTRKESWQNAIEKYGISYPQVSELKNMRDASITKAYGIHWIPSYVLVGPDGKVCLSTVLTWKLEKKLEEVFPGIKVPDTADIPELR